MILFIPDNHYYRAGEGGGGHNGYKNHRICSNTVGRKPTF